MDSTASVGYAQRGWGGVGWVVNEMQLKVARIIFNNFVTNEIYLWMSGMLSVERQFSAEQRVNVTDLTVESTLIRHSGMSHLVTQ
jgi:hypothetical protein